jgi:hypothetical protein
LLRLVHNDSIGACMDSNPDGIYTGRNSPAPGMAVRTNFGTPGPTLDRQVIVRTLFVAVGFHRAVQRAEQGMVAAVSTEHHNHAASSRSQLLSAGDPVDAARSLDLGPPHESSRLLQNASASPSRVQDAVESSWRLARNSVISRKLPYTIVIGPFRA